MYVRGTAGFRTSVTLAGGVEKRVADPPCSSEERSNFGGVRGIQSDVDGLATDRLTCVVVFLATASTDGVLLSLPSSLVSRQRSTTDVSAEVSEAKYLFVCSVICASVRSSFDFAGVRARCGRGAGVGFTTLVP